MTRWIPLSFALLAGCDSQKCYPDGDPAADVVGVQSGSFRSENRECSTSECAFSPHDGVSPLEMTVDEKAGRVVIRYQRDGKQVEELWRFGKRFVP